VCAQLLDAAAEAGEIVVDIDAYELMRGIGNMCVGAENNPRYDAPRMVELLIAGLGRPIVGGASCSGLLPRPASSGTSASEPRQG
jgi:hypothetical protein